MTAVPQPSNSFYGRQAIATSFYGLGGDASLIQSVHFQWGVTLAAVITIWSSNFREALLTSVVAGDWIQQNPPTGYTAISPAGAATVGANPLVLTIPGGIAGGAWMDLGNCGGYTLRAQVICTVADFLRITPNGKF